MKYKILDKNNIDSEHICCSISSKKGEIGINSKKAWLKDRFDDGLVFYKLDERGKVFIEYLPSEKVWLPIKADNGIHINCLWVAGKFKGQGHSNHLLDYCIQDAKSQDRDYISIISSDRKRPYLSDPKYLKYKGFQLADRIEPYYELLYLPLKDNINPPKFIDNRNKLGSRKGYTLYYSEQCPFAVDYSLRLEKIARERGLDFKLELIDSRKKAIESPAIFSTYTLFKDGEFLTNEILSEKKFLQILDKNSNPK